VQPTAQAVGTSLLSLPKNDPGQADTATHSQSDVLLYPHRKNSKYSQYKEAWHLLMPKI
jgi:hypothetical protein